MIHNRLGVPQLLELVLWHIMIWIMDRLPFEVFQLWNPVSDVVAVGVAFLGLSEGVEYSLRG